MLRRTVLRLVNTAGGRPVTSRVVMALLGAAAAGTAIAASSANSGAVTAMAVVRSSNFTNLVSQTNFVDLPGARATITVPSGQKAVIVARFSGQSSCEPAQPSFLGQCFVRILIGGVAGAPSDKQAFDEVPESGLDGFEAHEIERSRVGFGGLGPGTYTVQIQWATDGNVRFNISQWHLTVERSQVG
jgi:hypothetical protein